MSDKDRTEDPTLDWEELDHSAIVERVSKLRDTVEAISSDIIDDILLSMDIGLYDRRGNLVGEYSRFASEMEGPVGPCPFMFITKLKNSNQSMFLKITTAEISNPRYEVELLSPEILGVLTPLNAQDRAVVQCHRLLTRPADRQEQQLTIDLEGLNVEFLAVMCKLFTAILDCYDDSVEKFLNGRLSINPFFDDSDGVDDVDTDNNE